MGKGHMLLPPCCFVPHRFNLMVQAGWRKGQRREQGSWKPPHDTFVYVALDRTVVCSCQAQGQWGNIALILGNHSSCPNSITIEEGLSKWIWGWAGGATAVYNRGPGQNFKIPEHS